MTLNDLLDDYLDAVLERNPHVATLLGVHKYDGELPSGTRASVEDEIDTHPRQVRAKNR